MTTEQGLGKEAEFIIMETEAESQNRRNRRILGIVVALHWFALYTYVPYYTPYIKALGAAAALVGAAAGSYGLSQMILRIPIGITADKLSCQKFFCSAGLLLALLSSLGMRLIPNPYALLAFRLLSGVSAATWVCFPILFSGFYAASESTKAIADINACNNFGKLAATLAGGAVAAGFGMKSSFTVSVIAAAVGFVLCFFVKDVKSTKEPVALVELVKVAKNRLLLLGSFSCALYQFVVCATALAFTSNVAADLGANALQLSLVTLSFMIANFLVSMVVGRSFVKKLGEKAVVIFAFILLVVYAVCMPAVRTIWLIYVLQAVCGIANGIFSTLLMDMAVRSVAPEKKSTAMGAFQAIYGIGMTFGPMVMGSLVQASGYRIGYFVMAGVAAAGGVLIAVRYGGCVRAAEKQG